MRPSLGFKLHLLPVLSRSTSHHFFRLMLIFLEMTFLIEKLGNVKSTRKKIKFRHLAAIPFFFFFMLFLLNVSSPNVDTFIGFFS